VRQWIESVRPDAVINAAAYTLVDQAEKDPATSFSVNRDGPATLALACRSSGVPLVHISTDYVFNGGKSEPYLETDPVSPLGVYGKSKAEGELMVSTNQPEHIIVRTSWLYGVHGKNFVKTLLRIARERGRLSVVEDQYGCPTSAEDLAEAVIHITRYLAEKTRPRWGIYHFCNSGVTSWYGFAVAIFELAHEISGVSVPEILPIPTEAYPTDAPRPRYSALDTTRIQNHFGIVPRPWKGSLKRTLERMLNA
jgi:dTDP-4-dehydrorhamnose reductase